MKGITVKQPGGAEQLQLTEFPKPTPKNGELLIKVKAAAINRTDIINRESPLGYMTHPILGIEVSGIVEDAGPNTTVEIGTAVTGLVNGGGYAEYTIMANENAIPIPHNLTFEQAAAIPEVFLTAYQTLFWIGKLQAKESVLIHAGASGVGTAAIQLAKQLKDAHIVTTAGTNEKLAFCRKLGADIGINYKERNFVTDVLASTNQLGVDLILDFIGASYWDKNLKSVKVDGRWVLIGILGGKIVENVNIMDLLYKRVQITSTLLTPRSDAYKAALTKEFIDTCLTMFEENKLEPIVDTVFPLKDIQKAHEHMESNKNIGKIIIKI